MQEKLNSAPDDITEKSKNLDTLTEMSKSFDPEKAKQLVHQYSETHPDQNSDSHNYDNHSTVEQLSKKVEA